MELEEKAEEILETLWIGTEETQEMPVSWDDLMKVAEREVSEQLLEAGYISLTEGTVRLTDRGRPLARSILRRHRLAERLLADVLGAGDRLMHEKACKFEHLLDMGLDDSICSLLGHPKVCPHGKPIPAGRCCRQEQQQTQRLVSSLARLTQGQEGKVAYIYAPESSQLQKLMAMGILPGAPISLIQSFPSYVFQVRQTQFAVDKDIADTIYVRLVNDEDISEAAEEKPVRHKRRGGRLTQGFSRLWSKER